MKKKKKICSTWTSNSKSHPSRIKSLLVNHNAQMAESKRADAITPHPSLFQVFVKIRNLSPLPSFLFCNQNFAPYIMVSSSPSLEGRNNTESQQDKRKGKNKRRHTHKIQPPPKIIAPANPIVGR
jgi:hypothetical protein